MSIRNSILRSTIRASRTSVPAESLSSSLALARRSLSSSLVSRDGSPASSFVQSLLHGSKAAKEEGRTEQHSRLIGRGKYVHELIKHKVIPSKAEEYRTAAAEHFKGITRGKGGGKGDQGGPELMGSWEVVVGDLDTFMHVVRYPRLSVLTEVMLSPEPSPTLTPLLPFLVSRETSLLQEFAALPAHDNPALNHESEDGIFELRSYQLTPGHMLEWEGAWRKGIESRRKYISPTGAWFSQAGKLHSVHMLWRFKDLEARKEIRAKAWMISGWADNVKETVKLTQEMSSQMMRPCSWSPLK